MMIFLRYVFLIVLYFLHPFYLSVTEIKYNEKNKTAEIACKIFVNDLEEALKKTTGKSVDLLNAQNKVINQNLIKEYITQRLIIKINGQAKKYEMIGFEREEDAIWSYFEVTNCELPKSIEVDNKILYDQIKEQINLVRVEIGKYNQSSKVTNPDYRIEFKIN